MAGRGSRWALVLLLAGACRVTPPGALETSLLTALKHGVTVREVATASPLDATPVLVRRGRQDFSHYCVVCHGLDGHATGVPFAAAMRPPVPDLGSKEVQAYSDGQLRWIIENGLGPSGMPAARGILSDEEMWRIVLWLRHLPPPGSLGEPGVYGGEPAAAAGPR